MITPQRAIVRPTVRSEATGRSRLLDSAVTQLLRKGLRGSVAILGGPGSGKTTALQHIASLVPDGVDATFIDDNTREDRRIRKPGGIVFYSCDLDRNDFERLDLERFFLVPWDQDEWIEYLLAKHRSQCANVMQRLNDCPDFAELEGNPLLTRLVLDAFAVDSSETRVRSVLSRALDARLSNKKARKLATTHALELLFSNHESEFSKQPLNRLMRLTSDPALVQLVRQRSVREMLAVDRVVSDLHGARPPAYFRQRFRPSLIRALGDAVSDDAEAFALLNHVVNSRTWIDSHATAASLLVAANPAWSPEPSSVVNLQSAYLAGAKWRNVYLTHSMLRGADLSRADLTEASLESANLRLAIVRHACMHRATLRFVAAADADFHGADLSYVGADQGDFDNCDLSCANLEGALFDSAHLVDADLTGARLVRANLHRTDLRTTTIDEADFSGCCLNSTVLDGLNLTVARFIGATFHGAQLVQCNLEHMELPGADFEDANLEGSLLTGAVMPRANLCGANLRRAGLADIDLENADLRDADLCHATFHAGSSRSGLVGSPIACEGSRTGFYTDEYQEQGFLAPEEIRKANLRGADLRGARIEETDFYLVDLRDAIYDAEQEAHLRACRAILETPV